MKNISQKTLDIRQKQKNKQKLVSTIYLSNKKGFTLIELLIYMGLLTLLIVIFTQIFTSITDLQLGSRNTSNVSDDGRYIFSRFIYDVNRAEAIIEPSSPGSTSAALILRINGEDHTYSLQNNNLIITDATSSAALNGYGSTISNLLFTRIGSTSADTVRVNFTVNGVVSKTGIDDRQIFQTTAGIR